MSFANPRSGSIIVIVIVIMTFLAGSMIVTLIATQKSYSLAQSRGAYQRQCALLEGLLRVGVAYCCDHRTELFSSDNKEAKVSIAFDPWPCPEIVAKMGPYKGKVIVSTQKKVATIEAHLSNDKLSRSGSCIVHLWDEKSAAKKESKLRISNWNVDA